MAIVQTYIEILTSQLIGKLVTTPVEFRPGKEDAVLDFELPSRRLSFQFAVTGHTLRLIARDMRNEGVELSNIVLHDFREDEQPIMKLEAKDVRPE